MSAVLDRLRPHPHRGDVIAAGAVPLSLSAFLMELRMSQWSLGTRFAVIALISVLILTMGWLAPLESEEPRAYHSTLLIAGLLPLAAALVLLSEVLGARQDGPGAGAFAWTFGVEAGVAALAARRANSSVCTLIAAVAGAIAVEAFVSFAFKPSGLGTFRAFLLVMSLGFVVGGVRLHDRKRRHAVQLANAGGLLTLVLAATLAIDTIGITLAQPFAGLAGLPRLTAAAPAGWKLYILAAGFGLIAYAGVEREPGPGYVGVANLVAFALLAGLHPLNGNTLVGWPLILLVIGAAGLALGLRPREPLPPEPPTRPYHPPDEEPET
jgi:hypothetical protein